MNDPVGPESEWLPIPDLTLNSMFTFLRLDRKKDMLDVNIQMPK